MLKVQTKVYLTLFILFLSAGLLTAYYAFQPDSPASIADKIARDLQRELDKADQDVDKIISSQADHSFDKETFYYPFFIFENDLLIYWSDNNYVPSLQAVSDSFNVKLISTESESFLLKKRTTGAKRFVVSAILLKRKYPISNNYLNPEWNEAILPSPNVSILEPNSNIGIPVCVKNNCFFRISFLQGDFPTHKRMKLTAVVLLVGALIALVLLVYQTLENVMRRYPEAGFFYLLSIFLAVRFIMTGFDFPADLIPSPLFDAQVFAVSSLNASLGDLFINLCAVLALAYFLFRHYFRFHILNYRHHPAFSWVVNIASSLFILFAGLFPFVVIQTLYNNSAIVLDIAESLKFGTLRMVAMAAVLLSGVCSFLFLHVFIRILSSDRSNIRMWVSLFIGVILYVVINESTGQEYWSSLIITGVYFLVVYFLKLFSSLKRLSYTTFAYLFTAIFFLAVNGAYCIQHFSHREKIENQFRFASNFLIDRDDFGEYLLHEASHKIAEDVFIQTRMISPFLSKEPVKQKIRQVFLPSYFNKYDVDIYIFNSVGNSTENTIRDSTLAEVVNRYNQDAYRARYENIFFVNNPELDVTQKYLVYLSVQRSGITAGHIVIELSLKKIIPENVYPELLVDHTVQQFYHTQDLNYAVFANKKLIFSSGEFNYDRFFKRSWMGDPKLYTEEISYEGYDHVAQEDHTGRIGVVSTRQVPFIHRLANFSFLLVLGLLIILVMIFIQGVYYYFRGNHLFFSARIQLYLNLAFFIPLIIVSITTLSLTSRSSQEQLNNEYLNKSKTFGQQMTNYLDEYFHNAIENQLALSNRLNDLAKLSNLDANMYDASGVLMATSQPRIFENKLLSEYINSKAYTRIRNGENHFIESENVGKLSYFVSYATLKSAQTGEVIGILGIPFFQSAYLLEKIQIVILINILNIFALIFIVLLVLSYFVAEWLTFPLRFITQSLRRTSLTKINTPLTWNAADEIGMMVKEYNSMLFKLSESKSELEQTQREKAWREIAQQVAHEIKNPLTPMKLTLQQLDRSVQAGSNTTEKIERAISMLLSQVDTLNDIASSFSGFAKMPEPIIQRLELISLVRRSVDLHSPTGEISFKSALKEAWIMGDDQLLSRTFSNIILNGLQSGKPGQPIQVQVSIEKTGNSCRVIFQDNGKGIEPSIADRVFIPHFSTKKSGSGLGLAIAKQAIEQMNGKIWFETTVGKGTLFFIELPLIQ